MIPERNSRIFISTQIEEISGQIQKGAMKIECRGVSDINGTRFMSWGVKGHMNTGCKKSICQTFNPARILNDKKVSLQQ